MSDEPTTPMSLSCTLPSPCFVYLRQVLWQATPGGEGATGPLYGVDVIVEAKRAGDVLLNVHAGHGSKAMLLEVGGPVLVVGIINAPQALLHD